MDSNSPLKKECKIKNPQTFIDIKYIPVKSIIYIFNKNNKNTLNVVFMKEENLYVKTCFVDEALVIKRIKFDSRGRTGRNDHKTSHITVIVAEK